MKYCMTSVLIYRFINEDLVQNGCVLMKMGRFQAENSIINAYQEIHDNVLWTGNSYGVLFYKRI